MFDEWPKLGEYKQRFYRDCMNKLDNAMPFDYVEFIAEYFDVKNDEYDEINLFETSNKTVSSERHLISEQIINNENVVYSIVARDIDDVTNVLKLSNDGRENGMENYYKTNYQIFKTKMFKNLASESPNFNLIDKKNHKITAFIVEPKE